MPENRQISRIIAKVAWPWLCWAVLDVAGAKLIWYYQLDEGATPVNRHHNDGSGRNP